MSWIDKVFGEKEKEPPRPNIPSCDIPAVEIPSKEVQAYYDGKMTVEEMDYRFRKMEGLPKGDMPKVDFPKGVKKPNDGGVVFVPKPIEADIKLTVILVENTVEVSKYKQQLEKIFNSLVVSGMVCVINYGKIVREGKIVDAKDFDCIELLHEEFVSDNACLYDALIALENVVNKNYKTCIDQTKYKRWWIKNIEIIGIGRCIDNCSISSSYLAIESFSKVAKNRDITSKYFCLTEDGFIRAATIGFRSIGAISRNYM